MQLETVRAQGLAHNSYFLSDHGEAIVIDPRRDCEIYTELGIRECAQIKYIFESHRNEDLVVGSLDLQRQSGAEIGHSKETRFRYGDHNLTDSETFYVGDLKVEVLNTPGHTNDSLCFTVYELSLIHISEPTRLLSISYAVFCLKHKKGGGARHDA